MAETHYKSYFPSLAEVFYQIDVHTTRAIGEGCPKVPVIKCQVKKKGQLSQYFKDEDISEIKRYDLDFILRFGFGIIKGEILTTPRYGVWSYHHGDERVYRGQPSGFWELYFGDFSVGGILQRLTDVIDGGYILKCWSIKSNMVSWSKNIDKLRYAGVELPKQVCIDILNGEADYFETGISKSKAQMRFFPTNLEMCIFFYRIFHNLVKQKISSLFQTEDWNIGIVDKPIADFLENDEVSLVNWMPKRPQGYFAADPFAFSKGGWLHVYFEDFDIKKGKGVIQRAIVDEKFRVFYENNALSADVHLSYPYFIEHDGVVYMTPEMSRAGKVVLYRIDNETGVLSEVTTILEDVKVSDPTVYKYQGRWWLFGVIDGFRLYAWYSKELFGPWRSHANNPIKIDVCTARPAGTPFMHKGSLYRPSQDCSRTYGGSVGINKATRLTQTAFEEETVKVIKPDRKAKYPVGLHTMATGDKITLIDSKRWVFSPGVLAKKIVRKLT